MFLTFYARGLLLRQLSAFLWQSLLCCLVTLVVLAFPGIKKELHVTFKFDQGFPLHGTVRGVLSLFFDKICGLCPSFKQDIAGQGGDDRPGGLCSGRVFCLVCSFFVLCLCQLLLLVVAAVVIGLFVAEFAVLSCCS